MRTKKINLPLLEVFLILLAFLPVLFLLVGTRDIFLKRDEIENPKAKTEEVEGKECAFIEDKDFKTEIYPQHITINKINLSLDIAKSELKNGTWGVNKVMANYAVGTSLINSKSGNVGIFGHDIPEIFAPIKKLNPGDEIHIYGQGYRATYKVKETRVAKANETQVFYPTSKPTLTLVTCHGKLSEMRFVVSAELSQIERVNCNEKN